MSSYGNLSLSDAGQNEDDLGGGLPVPGVFESQTAREGEDGLKQALFGAAGDAGVSIIWGAALFFSLFVSIPEGWRPGNGPRVTR